MMGEITGMDTSTEVYGEGIPHGKSRRVIVPLPSGLLSATQSKMTPLRACNLTVELEINSNVVQYLNTVTGNATTWMLQDAQLKADLVTIIPNIAQPVYDLIIKSPD